MSESTKIAQGPHNPFLIETFRAFLAELGGGSPNSHAAKMAAQMTLAHVQFCQAQSLERVATALEDVVKLVKNPVELERILHFVNTATTKRTENRAKREETAKIGALDAILTATDEELAS